MGKKSREKREKRIQETEQKVDEIKKDKIGSVCLKLIRLGVYLILLTPLVTNNNFIYPTVVPQTLYFWGLSQIIFVLWLFLIVFSKKYRPKLNPLLGALILFLAVLTLSSVFGSDPLNSFWSTFERMTGLLTWFHLFAFFLVISSVFTRKEDWFKFFGASVLAAILVSLISLFSSREGATIGNTSFMAAYLLFNAFLALYLFLKTKGNLKIFSAAGFVLVGIGLFLSTGRAVILSFIAGLFLLFLFRLFFSKKPFLRILSISLSVVLLSGIVITLFFAAQPDNLVNQKIIQETTLKPRLLVWDMAWKGWQEKPWFGWGLENFNLVFSKYFDSRLYLPEYGAENWFTHAHNIVFDTLIASGLLGLLAYLSIFASSFYLLWKNFLRRKLSLENGDFLTPAVFSVILFSYFIQNLTVLDTINSYLMFFLILGFIGKSGNFNEKKVFKNKASPRGSIIIAVIIIFCLLFSLFNFIVKPIKSNVLLLKIPQTRSSEERIFLYKDIIKTSPLGKREARELFADFTLGFYKNGVAQGIPLDYFKKEFDFVSSELAKSVKETPLNFRYHIKSGEIYSNYGKFDSTKFEKSEEILKKAIEISPENQMGYYALGECKILQKKYNEAFSLAKKAVELEPEFGPSHALLSITALFIGDRKLAKKEAKEAIRISPELISNNSTLSLRLKEILEE